jgi:hypothetical protein
MSVIDEQEGLLHYSFPLKLQLLPRPLVEKTCW